MRCNICGVIPTMHFTCKYCRTWSFKSCTALNFQKQLFRDLHGAPGHYSRTTGSIPDYEYIRGVSLGAASCFFLFTQAISLHYEMSFGYSRVLKTWRNLRCTRCPSVIGIFRLRTNGKLQLVIIPPYKQPFSLTQEQKGVSVLLIPPTTTAITTLRLE